MSESNIQIGTVEIGDAKIFGLPREDGGMDGFAIFVPGGLLIKLLHPEHDLSLGVPYDLSVRLGIRIGNNRSISITGEYVRKGDVIDPSNPKWYLELINKLYAREYLEVVKTKKDLYSRATLTKAQFNQLAIPLFKKHYIGTEKGEAWFHEFFNAHNH